MMHPFPKTADVVVIGGGIIGASIAAFCAKLGAGSVILVEQNLMLGAATTAKNAGGVRAQFASEVNIRFSLESINMLEQWESALEGHNPHYQPLGYLFCTSQAGQWEECKKRVALQRSFGVNTQLLTPNETKKVVPDIDTDDLVGATLFRRDGIVETASLLMAYEKIFLSHGGTLLTETKAEGIVAVHGGIKAVLTDRGQITTEKVVNAAGPWASEIGRMAGVQIPVTPWRRQVIVTDSFPLADTFPMVVDLDAGVYMHKESGGLLMGWADPDQPKGFLTGIDERYNMAIIEKAMKRLPLLEQAKLLTTWAGHYETTPDHHGIVGAVKDITGFFVAAGFSGHGVMHSPSVGQVMAEMIVAGRAETLDPTPLRLERFAEGNLLTESVII